VEGAGFEPSVPQKRPRQNGSDDFSGFPGSVTGTKGSNPCTLESGYWLVGIVDWPDRAGLPGVAREIPVF
jgi:hypothetical protein